MSALGVFFFLGVATGCATFLYALHFCRPLLRSLEKRFERPAPKVIEPPPADLIALALGEATDWAREDALAALYELHADCGHDWGRTRNAYFVRAGVQEREQEKDA